MKYMRDNSLAFWFPILKNLRGEGISVPETVFIDTNEFDPNCVVALRKMFWMEDMTEEDKKSLIKFIASVEMAANKIGCPIFLRSGNTSNKHDWLDSCYVKEVKDIASHIQNIAEHSMMADMKGGWPVNIWALRKLIPTKPIFTAFNGFPVTREFRAFFRDHKLECIHPYWPLESLDGYTKDEKWKNKLLRMNRLSRDEVNVLCAMTLKVAEHFDGWWSLDWLYGKDKKWYAIDMAKGEDSFHWKGCTYAADK